MTDNDSKLIGGRELFERKMINTFECKCSCGAQAVCFWPCIDPDIKSYPYCDQCYTEAIDNYTEAIALDTLYGSKHMVNEQRRRTDECRDNIAGI